MSRIKNFFFFVLLAPISFCFSAQSLLAEDMVLVKDVNSNSRALRIAHRCLAGTNEFLFADDGLRGSELWLGDGIQGTTRLLKDINSGSGDGILSSQCGAIGNTLIFPATDGTTGIELWKSDGTPEGTTLLKEIQSGTTGSNPFRFTTLGTVLLFSADDGVNGEELWKTDGTTVGTVLVKDIYSGASSGNPYPLVKLNDTTVLFPGTTAAAGTELWKSDGTTDGTVLVEDIVAGATGSSPQDLTVLGNSIFFSATSAATGREPWISDGTAGGTSILADIFVGATSGFTSSFTDLGVVNNKVIFQGRTAAAGFELFVSDGTTGGTALLKDIATGAAHSFPNYFHNIGSTVLFSATTTTEGTELYSTDGTTSGTTLLADINTGAGNGVSLYSATEINSGAALLFSGSVVENGDSRVYSSNGTSVTLLTDLYPSGAGASAVRQYPQSTAGVSFGLPAPVQSLPEPGLFLSDGTAAGTIVHPGALSGFTESSAVIPMGELNGKLLFAADDGTHGMELWSSDGTDAGTTRLTDINEGAASSVIPQAGFAVVGGKLFFAATDSTHGGELWTSDGTSSGTSLLKDIEPGIGSSLSAVNSTRRFYVVGTKVVFAATTTAEGTELWSSNGTTGGTSLIVDLRAGASSGVNDSLSAAVSTSGAGDTLFFVGNNGATGEEVYATTTTVTGITADLVAGASGSSPEYLTPIPFGTGYFGVAFKACPAATGCEVYFTTGGAPSGIDVVAGATGSNPSFITFISASRMFFRAETAAEGTELWKSDTPFNTASLVKDVIPGNGDFEISELTKLDSSTLIFRGCGTATGFNCELWKSDGTSAGTAIVKDIYTGDESSGPEGFGVLNGIAYFFALDGTLGTSGRYFRTDGTEAGTTALTTQGVKYFSTSYLPAAFTPAVSTLFFGAFSSTYGYELFKIGEDLCPSDATKSVPGLCGCGVVDGDADGDGFVDCLEACASDPLKQEAGSCGCGVADTDVNGNSVADCLDSAVAEVTPTKPRVKLKRKNANVRMTSRDGVTYQVLYRIQRSGRRLSPNAVFKSKIVTTNTTTLRAPKSGFTLHVKYQYLVPDTEIESLVSKVTRRTR